MIQLTFEELEIVEFPDRSGIIRTIAHPTIPGRREFFQRLNKMCEAIALVSPTPTVEEVLELYEGDRYFRHNCDRCLQLHSIDPEWLDGRGLILYSMLFGYNGSHGLLLQMNLLPQPDQDQKLSEGDKPLSDSDVVAALWVGGESLENARKIVATVPAVELRKTMESRAKIVEQSDPTKAKKAKSRKWAEQQRKKAKPFRPSDMLTPEELAFRQAG